MKTLFLLIIIIIADFNCALISPSLNKYVYFSRTTNLGFKFAEPDNAKLSFSYFKGNWIILKSKPEKNHYIHTRSIWFINLNQSEKMEIEYFVIDFEETVSDSAKIAWLHNFQISNQNDYGHDKGYNLIGLNVGNNLLPNYLFYVENSSGISYKAEFFSGNYLIEIVFQSPIKSISMEDFITLLNSIKINDHNNLGIIKDKYRMHYDKLPNPLSPPVQF